MTLEELNTHLDMVMQLHAAIETLQHMQDKLLGAQQFDGMPHGSGAYRKTENLSIILEMQMDDVDRLKKIVKKSEKEVREWLETIPDSRTKLIFSLRFLCGYEWKQVAQMIGGKNTEGAVKSQCYRYLKIRNSL